MTKQLGAYFVFLGVIVMGLGIVIEQDFGTDTPTGNSITEILKTDVQLETVDYVAGLVIAVSVLMMLMGVLFYMKGMQS